MLKAPQNIEVLLLWMFQLKLWNMMIQFKKFLNY